MLNCKVINLNDYIEKKEDVLNNFKLKGVAKGITKEEEHKIPKLPKDKQSEIRDETNRSHVASEN